MDIQAFKVSADAIDAGIWVGDLPDLGDVRLRVRPWRSKRVRDEVEKRLDALGAADRTAVGRPKPEAVERVTLDVAAELVLVDWAGVTKAGEPLPYDPALARSMLADPDFAVFRAALDVATARAIATQREAEAEALGN